MNYTTANDSYVRVRNNGAYVAQFYLSYFYQGRTVTLDSGLFYVLQTRQINIPNGASNAHLIVIARIFGNFVRVYNSNISSTSPSCFVMGGTILNPYINQVPCNDLDTTPPNQCCCCCCNCCSNFPGDNGGVYIQISNNSPGPISFIVQYKVDVRTFTKKSPIFGSGKEERVQISHSALNICFNVLDNSTDPPGFITNVVVVERKKHCYNLTKLESGFDLTEVKC